MSASFWDAESADVDQPPPRTERTRSAVYLMAQQPVDGGLNASIIRAHQRLASTVLRKSHFGERGQKERIHFHGRRRRSDW
jgi:hypothetical protein